MRKLILFIFMGCSIGHLAYGQRVASFPLSEVKLLRGDGEFNKWSDNQRLDSAWMMSFPVKRLLHNFQTTAGVYAGLEGGYSGKQKVEKLGGWESMDCDLRGHAVGHLLSAYALAAAGYRGECGVSGGTSLSDNPYCLKGDSLVKGLRECQLMMGTGYISAFPEGLLKRNLEGKSVWAPWYTLHKVIAGLILQYQLCHNETALDICRDFIRWADNFLSDENLKRYITPEGNPNNEKLPCYTVDAVRQRALRNEFGGIGQSFYELYSLLNQANRDDQTALAALRCAQFFYHNEKLDPLYANNFDMGTQHCNTFLPKMAAELESYELALPVNPHAIITSSSLTGSKQLPTTAPQHQMVDAFWHAIVNNHVLAPGSLSDKEHFFDPKQTSKHLTGNTGETCCTYNLLKLTRQLYSLNPSDPQYFDYYERALYNHILGQQDPQTGFVHYFLPTQTGAYKLYSTYDKSFWCCVGSGFESHAKYGESIYWKPNQAFHKGRMLNGSDADTVYVNLFIPSELTTKDFDIRMDTEFPLSGDVKLTVNTTKPLVLMVRQPSWTGKTGYQTMKIKGAQKGWTCVLHEKMNLHTEATPDDPNRLALFYGPILLAGQLGAVDHPFSDPSQHNDYYGFDYQVPDSLKHAALNVKTLKRTGPLEWVTEDGIKIKPLYDTHRERYVVYWKKK